MPKELLNEREFELVNIVGAQLVKNQRDLSRHLNLSLGMTNLLLKRLVTKGYIRIQQLNQRKVRYLLTSRGFTEKMRKSVKYTLKTINSISLIKQKLKKLLMVYVSQGHKDFIVVGKSDLAMLVDVVLKEIAGKNTHTHYVDELPKVSDAVILNCKEEIEARGRAVNLIHELAKDQEYD